MHDHAPSSQPGQNDTKMHPRGDGRGAGGGTGGAHAEPLRGARHRPRGPQNSSLRAFAGKALTIVLAGFAFTMTTLPKISRFPALVAFFWRVLIMTTPGMTNLPFFFASCPM